VVLWLSTSLFVKAPEISFANSPRTKKMHLSIIFLCALSNFSSFFFAWAVASPQPNIMATDIDLDERAADGTNIQNLVKRTQVRVCGYNGRLLSGSSPINEEVIEQVSSAIAHQFVVYSGSNDCSVHSGSLDKLRWKLKSTNSCKTTAEKQTIDGAFQLFMRKYYGNELGYVSCLRLTHGEFLRFDVQSDLVSIR
jgi:hypothetical protein